MGTYANGSSHYSFYLLPCGSGGQKSRNDPKADLFNFDFGKKRKKKTGERRLNSSSRDEDRGAATSTSTTTLGGKRPVRKTKSEGGGSGKLGGGGGGDEEMPKRTRPPKRKKSVYVLASSDSDRADSDVSEWGMSNNTRKRKPGGGGGTASPSPPPTSSRNSSKSGRRTKSVGKNEDKPSPVKKGPATKRKAAPTWRSPTKKANSNNNNNNNTAKKSQSRMTLTASKMSKRSLRRPSSQSGRRSSPSTERVTSLPLHTRPPLDEFVWPWEDSDEEMNDPVILRNSQFKDTTSTPRLSQSRTLLASASSSTKRVTFRVGAAAAAAPAVNDEPVELTSSSSSSPSPPPPTKRNNSPRAASLVPSPISPSRRRARAAAGQVEDGGARASPSTSTSPSYSPVAATTGGGSTSGSKTGRMRVTAAPELPSTPQKPGVDLPTRKSTRIRLTMSPAKAGPGPSDELAVTQGATQELKSPRRAKETAKAISSPKPGSSKTSSTPASPKRLPTSPSKSIISVVAAEGCPSPIRRSARAATRRLKKAAKEGQGQHLQLSSPTRVQDSSRISQDNNSAGGGGGGGAVGHDSDKESEDSEKDSEDDDDDDSDGEYVDLVVTENQGQYLSLQNAAASIISVKAESAGVHASYLTPMSGRVLSLQGTLGLKHTMASTGSGAFVGYMTIGPRTVKPFDVEESVERIFWIIKGKLTIKSAGGHHEHPTTKQIILFGKCLGEGSTIIVPPKCCYTMENLEESEALVGYCLIPKRV